MKVVIIIVTSLLGKVAGEEVVEMFERGSFKKDEKKGKTQKLILGFFIFKC